MQGQIDSSVEQLLGIYKIEIAALSESRLAEIGDIKEVDRCWLHILLEWTQSEERREAGVKFAIKTDLVGKLSGLPKGIYDRPLTLRFPLSGNKPP